MYLDLLCMVSKNMLESEEDQKKVAQGLKPVKFSEEASLGGVISEKILLCTLGVKPIQNLEKEL